MLILRDTVAVTELEDGLLRQLILLRIEEISEYCPWDTGETGPFIVVEPGDADADIAAETGFSILSDPYNGTRFGDPGFSPAVEFA